MDIKVVKGSKSVEVIRMKNEKSSFHKSDNNGNTVLAKYSNVVIDKMGGLDKVVARVKKMNPKLNITIEDAPAPTGG